MSNEICCPQCGGYGEILDPDHVGKNHQLTSCHSCQGTGIKQNYCDIQIKKILESDKIRAQKTRAQENKQFRKSMRAAIDAVKNYWLRKGKTWKSQNL